ESRQRSAPAGPAPARLSGTFSQERNHTAPGGSGVALSAATARSCQTREGGSAAVAGEETHSPHIGPTRRTAAALRNRDPISMASSSFPCREPIEQGINILAPQ